MSWISYLLVFLLVLNSAIEVICETCPAQEDISPCKCVDNATKSQISVTCGKGTTLQEIENAVKHLRGKKVEMMRLIYLKFDRIPSRLFWDLSIRKLAIRNCDLQGLSDSDEMSAFVGLENSLEELSIVASFTGQNELTKINLSHLKNLRMLLIRYNNIPELVNDWFQNGPYNLTELYIEHNNIKALGDRAFASLVDLEYLYFNNNSISAFQRSILPNPATELGILSLENNNISSFPTDVFYGMPGLQNLYLAQNSIRRLPYSTWSSIWENIYHLDLSNNPLECDSHIEWMFKKKITDVLGTCSTPEARRGQKLRAVIEANKGKRSNKNVV